MNEPRQRTAYPLLGALTLLSTLAVGCQARGTVEAAQTAVVVAQTALPGAHATAQAAATAASGALSDSQSVLGSLQALLSGATLEVKTTPSDAANEAVTAVTIEGTDAHEGLTQVDARARQAAAATALVLASQYYPNATISLNVVDGSGTSLLKGTKAPGQVPAFQ
jgi:hypothetical protein